MTTLDQHQHGQHVGLDRPMHPNLVIAAMWTAVVVIIASVSSLNVALPSIGSTLSATHSEVQWIIDTTPSSAPPPDADLGNTPPPTEHPR